MKRLYIFVNLTLLLIIGGLFYYVVLPGETSDVEQINKKYREMKDNDRCIEYLKQVSSLPTWRFSLVHSAGFTLLLLFLYIISGYPFDKPIYFASFWVLFILNAVFIYKTLATWNYHYMCQDNCLKNWRERN